MGFGAAISGYFKKNTGEQKIKLDPQTKALNQFRLDTLSGLPLGGLSDAFRGLDYTRFPSYETNDLLSLGAQQAQQQGLTPEEWYQTSLQGLDINPAIAAISNYYDPAFSAGGDYYQQIVGPQLANEYSLMGLGRSGARGEAEAKAAAQIALPLQQQLAGSLSQLQSQYIQNLFALNQARPSVDTGLRQSALQRIQSGVEFSDYNRLAQQENVEKQLQGWLSLLSDTPYTAAPTTKTKGTEWGVSGSVSYGGGSVPTGAK